MTRVATALLVVFVAAGTARGEEATRVVVSYSADAATSDRQASLFTRSLQAELTKHSGINVVTDTQSVASGGPACAEEKSCLVKLAEALGADVVILARTAEVASGMVLTLKRLHIRSGEIEQVVTRRLRGDSGEAYLLALGGAVSELLPDHAIASGRTEGVPSEVVERWSPPPLPASAFWAGAGLTALALAAGVASGLESRAAQADYNAYAHRGGTLSGAELQRRSDKAVLWTRRANGSFIAVGLLAPLTVVSFFFVDWHDDVDVLPALTNGGAQVVLSGRF